MDDWDDLRFFLAVARGGSLSAAARALAVNHSTVFRRVNQFEERVGARLFERRRDGYALTAAGETVLGSAERVEGELQALDRRVAGEDVRLEGTVRLTAPDDVALRLLPRHLAGFRTTYPGIHLDLILADRFLDLSRRDADVALRPSRDPGAALVGRRIAAIAFAVYRGRAAGSGLGPLAEAPWISGEESVAHIASSRWVDEQVPPERVVLRTNSMEARAMATRAGIGLAALPCFVGDGDPGLVRATDPVPEIENELWLLTHPDLRRTARIRALLDFLAEALQRDRDLLEGRRPRA